MAKMQTVERHLRTAHDVAWKMAGRADAYMRLEPHNAPLLLEQAIAHMVKGWELYAEAHRVRFGTSIGNDYFFRPHWLAIGQGLLAMLNGETGRLHCGLVDRLIRDAVRKHVPGQTDIEV